MTKRTTPIFFRAMLEMSDTHSLKFLRGSTKRTSSRNLSSRGVLQTRRPDNIHPVSNPRRHFINLVAPITTRKVEYTESRILGYTPQQLYGVVANVDQYQHFVPWCAKSRAFKGESGDFQAELEIGFPPVVERYTSEVTVIPNHKIRAVCTDGSVFRHLETVWRFFPGASDLHPSCKVHFYVSFEFKSLLHCHLTSLFFDEVVKQMIGAFDSRAAVLYGKQQGAVATR
ncbi:coenzyme Q-binding protein COQ10 homolog, mitochondrial isoform X1 [Takifugu rubripes]|uniref:coenzyme Q-binding protein COQ10 homolog, mitochondrial isoform X1 n=1 Tax=Takifugu rubripes TaxID=31033 RepID=UPI001145CF1F|nr:coenzyme Q-binding protein COQ10 homolog, mitochondrial-like isoform X1 [Takifugu rubripes]